ncbi:hypothetical protein [Olivibacter jilunii]|uniref:hypothetical protein n=1 Tax=Olivibacter jilunii TaxID=985016 RepID=UPI003F143553
MATLLGKFLDRLDIKKSEVGNLAKVKKPRLNDLCNKDTAKPSPEEFYRIVFIAIKLAGRKENEFNDSVDEIFPERPKNNLLAEFSHLPPDIQFLKKYTQKQSDVEDKIGMADGKISRLASEKVKDLLAVEIICFIEGMGLDLLSTLKDIYGEIVLEEDKKDTETT